MRHPCRIGRRNHDSVQTAARLEALGGASFWVLRHRERSDAIHFNSIRHQGQSWHGLAACRRGVHFSGRRSTGMSIVERAKDGLERPRKVTTGRRDTGFPVEIAPPGSLGHNSRSFSPGQAPPTRGRKPKQPLTTRNRGEHHVQSLSGHRRRPHDR